MHQKVKRIGILGAGKLGVTLAQLAIKAGYEVYIAGSGDSRKITLSIEVLAPGANAVDAEYLVHYSDIVILALPLGKFRKISASLLADKLIIDAMNHWWEVDGERSCLIDSDMSSSEAVQTYFADSRVVKAFNHVGYHHLHDDALPYGVENRKAIAIAGDNMQDIAVVSGLVDDLGFDPLSIGVLSQGLKLEPGTKVFGAHVTMAELKSLL